MGMWTLHHEIYEICTFPFPLCANNICLAIALNT